MEGLKEKFVQVAGEYGFVFKENELSLFGPCPACKRDETLFLFKNKVYGKCHACGAKFSAVTFLRDAAGLSYREARDSLGIERVIDFDKSLDPYAILKSNEKKEEQIEVKEMPMCPDSYLFSDPVMKHRLQPGLDYLRARGITDEQIRKYQLRYSPSQKRVVIPVYKNDVCVGWQARDVTGLSDLRYNSPSGFLRSRVLLGYDLLNPEIPYVVLSEGPFDAIKLDILGNSLCSMGKNVSNTQVQMIRELEWAKTLYLALDPDAIADIVDMVWELSYEKKIMILTPPYGVKDFGDCTPDQISKSFEEASDDPYDMLQSNIKVKGL